MAFLFWDASALAKRYTLERGSDVVNALFRGVSSATMATTAWGFSETFAILVRNKNRGMLDDAGFEGAAAALANEIVADPNFAFFFIEHDDVLRSITLISRHNLNATDAALLGVLLDFIGQDASQADSVVLVASDKRLLRAAEAEGIETLNPEIFDLADLGETLDRLSS